MKFSADMHDPQAIAPLPEPEAAYDAATGETTTETPTIDLDGRPLACGEWVEVTTAYGHYTSGFRSSICHARPAVGCVTYISETAAGFEMTTGQANAFKLSEIRMEKVSSMRRVRRPVDHGRHDAGFSDARSRASDAARKKMSREKREGMFR